MRNLVLNTNKNIISFRLNHIPVELRPEGAYEKEFNVNIDGRIFDLLDPLKPITFNYRKNSQSSFYDPKMNIVEVGEIRVARSKWMGEAVIYHEFGHAIDCQRKLRFSSEIQELMDKYRKLLINDFSDISLRMDNLMMKVWSIDDSKFYKINVTKYDVLEQINKVLDTLQTLNLECASGHKIQYYKTIGMREAEFIAHAFENKFAGNQVFKKVLPELYDDMICYIDKLK